MAKRQKRKRSVFLPLLAVLLVLALAGTVLFSAFREKIDRWEYPQRYEEYVEYYAGKYGIRSDDSVLPSSAPKATSTRMWIPTPGHAA